jgi:hypothetical protein
VLAFRGEGVFHTTSVANLAGEDAVVAALLPRAGAGG